MTRSEIFRNNYKHQLEESKKETRKGNKPKIGRILAVSGKLKTIEDLSFETAQNNCDKQER